LPAPMIKEGVTQKIAEHVYAIPDFDAVLVPNVAIVVGSRGALVVDTGLGARNGQAVMREVEKVSKGPELYLVATHIHPEHDLGAGGFPARTKMLRSKEQEADIQETGLSTAKIFANFSPAIGELLQGAEFRKADISFDREHVVDLGGVRARVMAMGANHTKSDIAVFVEPDRVLVSGDLAMMGLPQFTAPSARFATWLATLDRFDALKPVRIVPSHGAMGDASMIATYRAFLTTVRDRAAMLKKDGRTIDETVRTLQDELQGRFNRGQMASAVRAAYNEAQ
jgi:glyoxylase-like metal-dependent hydrolase (beta-lactamase superfamily II)